MCSESCSKLFKNKRLEFMKDHLARNQDFDRKKNNDSIRIFAGDWLSYSILFISWRSFAGSFWIINLKDDPSKFDWKFFLNFFTFLFRFSYSISSGVSLIRKYKDLIKFFATLSLECFHNLMFRIIPRFITDPCRILRRTVERISTKKLLFCKDHFRLHF